MDMYLIYYPLYSPPPPFFLVNCGPYIRYIILIELLLGYYIIIGIFVQCWYYKSWLYYVEFAVKKNSM